MREEDLKEARKIVDSWIPENENTNFMLVKSHADALAPIIAEALSKARAEGEKAGVEKERKRCANIAKEMAGYQSPDHYAKAIELAIRKGEGGDS